MNASYVIIDATRQIAMTDKNVLMEADMTCLWCMRKRCILHVVFGGTSQSVCLKCTPHPNRRWLPVVKRRRRRAPLISSKALAQKRKKATELERKRAQNLAVWFENLHNLLPDGEFLTRKQIVQQATVYNEALNEMIKSSEERQERQLETTGDEPEKKAEETTADGAAVDVVGNLNPKMDDEQPHCFCPEKQAVSYATKIEFEHSHEEFFYECLLRVPLL